MRGRLTAVALGAVLLVAGCGLEEEAEEAAPEETAGESAQPGPDDGAPGAGDTTLPGLPTAGEARDQLAGLTVAEPRPMTGYSRDRFPHWATQEGCTVRQLVLRRDGEDVQVDDDCQPTSGSWHSPYEDEVYTEPGDVDIDHMVPLANAWRSGADTWTDEERETFANDLDHPQLIAVGDTTNSEKGDQSPDQWLPPAEEFGCTYGLAWTSVKHTYELTVTEEERAELVALLDSCG
ncbi:HNH endonuclease family protein [Streptomyces sp. SBT349]|uniref:HNH endonuclease family protein n=1 Tax=Streptomyces sp. SBT349 TaxID=1580539 RepID=UPI000B191017|nr:HNH endonuclease family protein [Streptomyces sp. SBT349]